MQTNFSVTWQTGLIEASTPECRSPGQLLLYQRAQERLLTESLQALAPSGGRLSLRKNCMDAAGNVYGAQESYSIPVATGWRLHALRAGLVGIALILIPCSLLCRLLVFLLLVLLIVSLIIVLPIEIARGMIRDLDASELFSWLEPMLRPLNVLEGFIRRASLSLPGLLFLLLMRALAFRPQRTQAAAFLASRQVISGAGTLREDGGFSLAEKASVVQRVFPLRMWGKQRYMFDPANLHKDLLGISFGESRRLLRLARPVWRLQVGMSDANMCHVAEYLKIGTTVLTFDAIEAGALVDAPRLARPAEAARTIAAEGIHAEVALRNGGTTTGLALQRWYHTRLTAWLTESGTVSMEAHDVLQRWGDVLDRLEHDPDDLIGELDWVTKQALIDEAGEGLSDAARKKIDLRYHEIGTGYFAWLDDAGGAVRLLTDSAIDAAIHSAPDDTPATMRGRLIRESPRHARVDWDEASIGGRVISFTEHVKKRGK